jgi:hypothetical protein
MELFYIYQVRTFPKDEISAIIRRGHLRMRTFSVIARRPVTGEKPFVLTADMAEEMMEGVDASRSTDSEECLRYIV